MDNADPMAVHCGYQRMILTRRAGRHGGGGQAIVDRYRGVGPNYAAYGARDLLAWPWAHGNLFIISVHTDKVPLKGAT